MHRALLGLAALIATIIPNAAAHGQQFVGSSTMRSSGVERMPSIGNFCRDFRRDGERHHQRSQCRTDVVMDWDGGEWALYNNRSWQPDSYNDWWHERPDRAYPRWMSRNLDCARRWYSADTLTC